MDELPIGTTEEERAEQASVIVEILTNLMTVGRYAEAIELAGDCESAFWRQAPTDDVAVAEIRSVAMFALVMSGDLQGSERAGLLLLSQMAQVVPQLEAAAPPAAAVVGGFHDRNHHLAVGNVLADLDAAPTDRPVWRLVRARRALGCVENSLGVIYLQIGDFPRSRWHLSNALALRTGRPEDRYLLSQTHSNLGEVELAEGRHDAALAAFRESIAIERTVPGITNFPGFIAALRGYARALKMAGDRAAAEAEFRKAGDLARSQTPVSPREVAITDLELAELLLECGCTGEARVLAEQASARLRATPANTDPKALARAQWIVGMALWAQGDAEACAAVLENAAFAMDLLLFHSLQLADEEVRLARTGRARTALDVLLSFAYDTRLAEAERLAFAVVTRRKALATEVHFRQAAATRSHQIPEIITASREIDALRARIADAFVSGSAFEDVRTMVLDLRDRETLIGFAERLARDMGTEPTIRTYPGSYTAWHDQWADTPGTVADALPLHSALIEYVRFAAVGPPPWEGAPVEGHYCAFVVSATPGQPRFVPLGRASEIDAKVAELRHALDGDGDLLTSGPQPFFPGSRTEGLGESVRVAVLDPVLAIIGDDVRTLILSPDCALTTVPFAILPWEDGHLVDRYAFMHVDTCRDLVREPASDVSPAPALVLADPDADAGAVAPADPDAEGFTPLPGAREEGIDVAVLLGVEPLLGAEATKVLLGQAAHPVILHIACHGWFLPAAMSDDDPPWASHPRLQAMTEVRGVRAWGAQSGLVLAGFNPIWRGDPPTAELGNGLFTADEVAQLDLAGTQIVVLSACDTGQGEMVGLEGVVGLRRAFLQAGARTVLATQWLVPDEPARLLVTAFYHHLLDGAPREVALSEAQREVREVFPHPYAWGAFVLHGDPGPLPAAILDSFPPDPAGRAWARHRRAAETYRRGDVDGALALLAEANTADAVGATLRGVILTEAGRMAEAASLLRSVAERGYAPAAQALAEILRRDGEVDTAITWYRRAVDAGELSGAQNLAALLASSGNRKEACRIWRIAAEGGDLDSQYATGNEQHMAGHPDEAETWWRRAAAGGDPRSAIALAQLAAERGDESERLTWWRRAAEAGDAGAALNLGQQAYLAGRLEEARDLSRAGAEHGDPRCAHNLGIVLQDLGLAGADGWWRRAAAAGVLGSANRLASLLESRGDLDGAAHWWERAACAGHETAGVSLGLYLHQHGRAAEAEQWLRPAAEAGQREAAGGLGRLLQERGHTAEAAAWLRRAADAGEPRAAFTLAKEALKRGDAGAALPLLTTAIETGLPEALALAGDWSHASGNDDAAIAWWIKAGRAGNGPAAARAAAVLLQRGDVAGADAVLDPVRSSSPIGLAGRVARLVKLDPAVLRTCTDLGHMHALYDLGMLADLRGDAEETARMLAVAADAGDARAWLSAASYAAAAGKAEDATRFLLRAASHGSVEAAEELCNRAAQRGDRQEADTWARRAQELIQAQARIDAAANPAISPEEAALHLRSAAEVGMAEAVERLAATLVRAESAEAEEWVGRAAELGDYLRPAEWGTVLHKRGRVDEAEYWWARSRKIARGR